MMVLLLTCAGLLCQIKRHRFFHTGQFLVRVIGVLKAANGILQFQSVDMCSDSRLHEDEDWGESFQAAAGDASQPSKRRRTMRKCLG